jgi:hypothetical protein
MAGTHSDVDAIVGQDQGRVGGSELGGGHFEYSCESQIQLLITDGLV